MTRIWRAWRFFFFKHLTLHCSSLFFFSPHDVRLFDVLSAKRRERHRRPLLVFPTIFLRGAAIKFCTKGKDFVAHNSFDLTILDGWPKKASFIWYIFQLHLGPYVMMKSLTRICHFTTINHTTICSPLARTNNHSTEYASFFTYFIIGIPLLYSLILKIIQ